MGPPNVALDEAASQRTEHVSACIPTVHPFWGFNESSDQSVDSYKLFTGINGDVYTDIYCLGWGSSSQSLQTMEPRLNSWRSSTKNIIAIHWQ